MSAPVLPVVAGNGRAVGEDVREHAEQEGPAGDHTALLAAGLTRRQIDHWTTKGWLRAGRSNPGSGNRRTYSADEMRCARIMAQLVAAGLQVEKAAIVAREPEHVTTLLLALLVEDGDQ